MGETKEEKRGQFQHLEGEIAEESKHHGADVKQEQADSVKYGVRDDIDLADADIFLPFDQKQRNNISSTQRCSHPERRSHSEAAHQGADYRAAQNIIM